MGKRSRRLHRFMMNSPTGSRAVFAGDVVFGGVHSFMNDGHTSEWLASLEALKEALSGLDILYTGGAFRSTRRDDLRPKALSPPLPVPVHRPAFLQREEGIFEFG